MNEWENQKPELRAKLWHLLGDLPALFTPQAKSLGKFQRDGFVLEKIAFENGADATVYGYLLIPDPLPAPAPAILYNHYHGGKHFLGKSEVLFDRGTEPAAGAALVKAGFVVLAVDSYAFGERQDQGPAGAAELGAATELSLAKKFLWEGRTLWGMIVRDDLLALNYLLTRPEVEPSRIGTTGMSMGSSRATWLAALDDRIQVVIPIAQMTRYQDFDRQGIYSGHGIYYFLPGVLKSGIDMEHIAALAAPHPQLVLIGDSDPLSPIGGVHVVDHFVKRIYALYQAADAFQTVIYPGIRHEYTSAMFHAMVNWFQHRL